MVFDMNSATNIRNLAESPLITVTGELEDVVLDKFAEQLKNDLGRKCVDYKRPEERTFSVFLEANFVRLDENRHWLSDLVLKKFQQKSRLNNLAHYSSSSTAIDRRNLNGQSFSISSTNQYPSIPYHRANAFTSLSNSTSSVRRNHSFNVVRKNNSFTNNAKNPPTQSDLANAPVPDVSLSSHVNHQLIEFLGQRVTKTNGAAVLLNTFWLKASHDLESYNSNVRKSLMDWFGKLLLNIAANIAIGVSGSFNLDCAILIVLPKDSQSSAENPVKAGFETPRQGSAKKSFFKSGLGFSNSSKFSLKASSNLSGSISSGLFGGSLSSLNGTNQSTPASASSFSLVQLVEQIRNDLTVTYQVFHQKQFSSGNLEPKLPANASSVIQQLIERIVIFDGNFDVITAKNFHNSTSNIAQSSTPLSAKGFSLGDSIKISTNSLMSPSKGSNKKANTNGFSDLFAFTPINYNDLLTKLRLFLRDSYVDILSTFETTVRHQREMQNKSDWDFFEFFLLQEELSLVYENLGMYDKALVQYDELDALFSQSILNTNAAGGVGPKWVNRRLVCDSQKEDFDDAFHDSIVNDSFVSLYNSWNGLCLCNPERTISIRHKLVSAIRRDSIELKEGHDNGESDSALDTSITTTISGSSYQSHSSPHRSQRKSSQSESTANFVDPLGANYSGRTSLTSSIHRNSASGQISLIDFRNYLFARQCHLLCMLNKPWDLAGRALPFLHSCVSEINLLEISIAPGGIACWVFCSVLEILYKCERYSDSSQLESYSYFTVGLWSYARDKLAELGRLCCLMPGSEDPVKNVSVHLHRMVELTAGMGADPHLKFGSSSDEQIGLSPQERLKDALSSAENFLKIYLEITELTMGTYKHIGYIRSARLIGKELSQLYLKLQRPQQALPFLLDLYNMFQAEKWNSLKVEASKLMAECLEALYYSAFSDQSQIDRLDPNSTGFNLEATVRSAFRTFLLHLVKQNSNDENPESENSFYLNKITSLLRHYQENGIILKEIEQKLFNEQFNVQFVDQRKPLLAIHNVSSDLFYDDYNSTSNISTHSSGSSNQNSTQKCAKTKESYDKHKTISSRNHYSNYQRDHFFKVKSINIICDDLQQTHSQKGSPRKVSTSSIRPDQNSFIAGSLLTMHIQIHSELTFNLALDHLQVTMQTSNSMQNCDFSNSCSSLDAVVQADYYGNETLVPHAHMESYLSANGLPGVKCLNKEQILHRSEKANLGGNLKFLPQLPVSLLNQRLADDEYNFRHYRFLGSRHHFDLVNPNQSLHLKPGLNEYCLQFTAPDSFNCNEQDSGNVEQNSNQLWFKMDQIVLFVSFPPKLPSAIVDDFDDMAICSSSTFRLVKCPPTMELIPYNDLQTDDNSEREHTSLIIGLDHLVCLRIKSGTNVLPKGLKCFIKLLPQDYTDNSGQNIENITFDHGVVEVTLHRTTIDSKGIVSVDNEKLEHFLLEKQIEPFECFDMVLTVRSQYIKPQICFVNEGPIPSQFENSLQKAAGNSLSSANTSFMFSKDFVLDLFNDSQDADNILARCQFVLNSPYLLYTKLHTVTDRKLIEICLRGPAELGSRKLQIEIHDHKTGDATDEIYFQPLNRPNQQSNFLQLKANSELKILCETIVQNSETLDDLNVHLSKFLSNMTFWESEELS